MSLHDQYARVTPFELAFQDRLRAEELVAEVDEESTGRGADPEDPHAFVTMGAVANFVRALEGPDSPPGAIHQYGALAFHGVSFTRAGFPLYLLSTHVARYLVDGAPGLSADPPEPAGYLQLPQHLFWADAGGETPESVDGIFWTSTKKGLLHTLIVAGMRADRPGLAVVPLPEAPLQEIPEWLDADVRDGDADFSSRLPGSEFDALYSFAAAGEVLKLLARFFAYVKAVPAGLQKYEEPDGTGSGPQASRLPFTRVALDG